MDKLPDKVVRFDTLQVEYGKAKMCRCHEPHYEIDYQNRLVYCMDCKAIVDPLEALVHIARDCRRWEEYTGQLLEQRRQIDAYQPRRTVIKELEKLYIRNDRSDLVPTCPHCHKPFWLSALLTSGWVHESFIPKGSPKND